MENEFSAKRGLVLILIIATVVIFVGLVWLIATYLPLNKLGFQSPSATAGAGVDLNCTYPISYWKEHPELYPSQMVIGGKVYMEKDLEGILSDETQEPAQQLQAQLVGVFLNITSGADQGSIEATIFEAYGWLVQHPAGSQVKDSEREAGNRLFNVLEAYNDGLSGVLLCDGMQIPTLIATRTPTETPTVLLTLTPSQTITPTASETPTPTSSPTTPVSTVIVPSRTPTPPNPTRTQAPPTNTPIIPTKTPNPTSTTAPPPTRPPTATPIPTYPPTETPTP